MFESASAVGLAQLQRHELDPWLASSHGVGDLIVAALKAGARQVVVGLGGTACLDGGAGMAQAIGVNLLDAAGHSLPPGVEHLGNVHLVDTSRLDQRLWSGVEFIGASDVRNPLCGPEGISYMYGEQKGASEEDKPRLEAALQHYAAALARHAGVDVASTPGAGAGGGVGAALLAFMPGASLMPGFELVSTVTGLEARVATADFVITGEGRLDRQSLYGKTTVSVARIARDRGVPVIAVCGSLGPDWTLAMEEGLTAAYDIWKGSPPGDVTRAESLQAIARTTELAVRDLGLAAVD